MITSAKPFTVIHAYYEGKLTVTGYVYACVILSLAKRDVWTDIPYSYPVTKFIAPDRSTLALMSLDCPGCRNRQERRSGKFTDQTRCWASVSTTWSLEPAGPAARPPGHEPTECPWSLGPSWVPPAGLVLWARLLDPGPLGLGLGVPLSRRPLTGYRAAPGRSQWPRTAL